jgi:hypothetical protein
VTKVESQSIKDFSIQPFYLVPDLVSNQWKVLPIIGGLKDSFSTIKKLN